eukprot:1142088-Pelagomonas_calceolata.AAC.4
MPGCASRSVFSLPPFLPARKRQAPNDSTGFTLSSCQAVHSGPEEMVRQGKHSTHHHINQRNTHETTLGC